MGSSTRNTYSRSKRIIDQGIEKGVVNKKGAGLGELLATLMFPKNGQSKIKAVLSENLYSRECITSIKNIIKVSNAVSTNTLSSIGLGDILTLSDIEVKEKLCDFFTISENELLKTSLKEALNKQNLLDKANSVIRFIAEYVKNIISNVYKQFTYEDTLNALEDFDTQEYDKSIDDCLEEKVVPAIELEFQELNIYDDAIEEDNFVNKVKNAFSSIIRKLRGEN